MPGLRTGTRMRLAHISDLHLLPPELETAGPGPTSIEVATAIADDLASIGPTLDVVVVSGDLVDRADAGSFARFEGIFGRIGVPLLVVPGNHDGPAGMHDYMSRSPVLGGWNLTNRVAEIGGIRFLGLDTNLEGRTDGALDDAALDCMKREVRRDSDRRLVVVMHHPPLLLGLAQFDGFCRIERGAELLAILKARGAETLVLSGHVHRPYTAREGNITCHVAGSLIAPYDSALPFGTDPIRPAALQDFYFIHDFDPTGRHVVTLQRVRGLVPGGRAIPTSSG